MKSAGCCVSLYLVALQLCIVCSAAGSKAAGPVVQTKYGKIQGKYTDQAQVFKSIPYGTPPVKELRWKDPRPPVPWNGTIATVDDPPGCPQSVPCGLPLPEFLCPAKVSEDCLYLNVFTPRNATSKSRLPVMFFIHGGNFLRGYSGGDLYDGQYIANTTGTIVVTANYRLGAIGYLVYGSGDNAITGNYGLKDQTLALEWVRDNIEQFGGDPNQVTFWGQSAGAVSAAIQMTRVQSFGLFNKAIMESEPFAITLKDVTDAKKLGDDFAKELGCGTDDFSCLYSKDIAEIAKAQVAVLTKIIDIFHVLEVFLQWTPIVDGVEVLDQPFDLFVRGETAKIPYIIGTTSQESQFFVYEGFTKAVPELEFDALIVGIFGFTHYGEIHRRYPTSGSDTRPAMAAMGTDYTFTCPTRYAVRGFVKTVQEEPVWLYVFNHSISFNAWGKNYSYCNGHSCHGVELPFVFNTAKLGGFNFTKDEQQLAINMVQYWTNFAHHGDPNGAAGGVRDGRGGKHHLQTKGSKALLSWPRYDGSDQAKCMRFKTPESGVITNYQGDTCDFWDAIGYTV